jgi:hypothetical protein
MNTWIVFALSNFTLTFFILGICYSFISLILRHPTNSSAMVERFLVGYLLFAVGFSFLYNFVMHVFFGDMAARFIGWANSPFQYEVGYASLGFAIVAILAAGNTFHFRLAAIIGPAFFLWGAAVGHIYQIVVFHNFSPGNAGVVLWTDIFLPLVGFTLLYFSASCEKPNSSLQPPPFGGD